MEHNIIQEWATAKNIEITKSIENLFIQYSTMICETNKKFNITGHKSREDILKNLILKSLDPLCRLNVPRGTSFVDMGSGAGIPGIPIGIFFNGITGLLIDSSLKKIEFVKTVINELKISNVNAIAGRIEDLARNNEYREMFNLVFARAVGNIYIVLELGSPFLSPEGLLYVYSNNSSEDLHNTIILHARKLGMAVIPQKDHAQYGFENEGILFKKIDKTDLAYPRRFAVIKRESDGIEA